jgi:azurin
MLGGCIREQLAVISDAMSMKLRLLLASALIALVTSGCGPKDSAPNPAAAAAASAPAPAPDGPRTVEITAGDNMKFSLTSIEAKPGEQLTVILTNIGSQPKEVMGHNWILLKAGTDAEAFDKAAALAKDTDYFPAALANQVLTHIPLLGPRKSGQVTFTAPTAPGEYAFLCSYPAHFQVGMKGTLIVK